jgi:hypothetical protein
MLASFLKSIPKIDKIGSWIFIALIPLVMLNIFNLKKWNYESHYSIYKEDKNMVKFLVRDLLGGSYFAYALDKVNSSVTSSDIKAFQWIRNNVDKDAVFATNYGDSGPLITSIGERKIFAPHGMDIWHGKEMKDWQLVHRPNYVYIGKERNLKYPDEYKREDCDSKAKKYNKIYDQDGVSIYKIIS